MQPFLANQQFAKSIEPRKRNLHGPAVAVVALGAPMRLFAAGANVWHVVARSYRLLSWLAGESGIGAQMLQDASTHCGPANAQNIKDGFK